MALVKWMVTTNASHNLIYEMGSDNLVAVPPEKLLPNLAKEQPGMLHYTCPAFVDTFKNTYIIRAPFDFCICVDPANKTIQMDKSRELVEKYLLNRCNDAPMNGNVLFSIQQFLLFITDEEVEVETLPCYYHQNDFVDKTMLVSGRFNIKNWIRTVEAASLVKNSTPENKNLIYINVSRGDALFYVRFHTNDNSVVKLEQEFDFDKIEKYTKYTWVTTMVKKTNPHLKLPQLYKMFERFRPKKFFSKCPFSRK